MKKKKKMKMERLQNHQEMVKTAGERDLVNQIIVEGVIPAEWLCSSIVSCCKRKGGLWKEKTIGVWIRSD